MTQNALLWFNVLPRCRENKLDLDTLNFKWTRQILKISFQLWRISSRRQIDFKIRIALFILFYFFPVIINSFLFIFLPLIISSATYKLTLVFSKYKGDNYVNARWRYNTFVITLSLRQRLKIEKRSTPWTLSKIGCWHKLK